MANATAIRAIAASNATSVHWANTGIPRYVANRAIATATDPWTRHVIPKVDSANVERVLGAISVTDAREVITAAFQIVNLVASAGSIGTKRSRI